MTFRVPPITVCDRVEPTGGLFSMCEPAAVRDRLRPSRVVSAQAMLPSVCTVIGLVRPDRILLAANRDERIDRAWDPQGAWWPGRPGVIGGSDRTAGGTWMAINRDGVVATVLNRRGTLGPAVGNRSRGELPLLALEQATAREAADTLTEVGATLWRGFNMVLADRTEAWSVKGIDYDQPQTHRLPPGVSMITAYDPNALDSPRAAYHLPHFQAAELSWDVWHALLSDRSGGRGEPLMIVPRGGFGTVCSSFVTLPAAGRPIWLCLGGLPHTMRFVPSRWRSDRTFCDTDGAAIPACLEIL